MYVKKKGRKKKQSKYRARCVLLRTEGLFGCLRGEVVRQVHGCLCGVVYLIDQWFSNLLASDPKEKLDVCPGPKLVKTADLQAHNALRACRSAIFTAS